MPRFRLVSVMASPVKKGQRFYSLKRRQVVIIGPSGCNFRDDPLVWHAMTLSAPAIDALYRQLEVMRPLLVRFAVLQLRNQALAEDAVQDALIAVLEKPERFAGQSSLRTYVTGILKFKIIDNLRATTRERQIETYDEQSEDDVIDALFVADGHTRDQPLAWGDPDRTLEQKDFFRVLEVCLEKLPAKTARIFMMREWLELETEEICKELAITTSNALQISSVSSSSHSRIMKMRAVLAGSFSRHTSSTRKKSFCSSVRSGSPQASGWSRVWPSATNSASMTSSSDCSS